MGLKNPFRVIRSPVAVQTAAKQKRECFQPAGCLPAEAPLYEALRHTVPLIDAALQKIVRLSVDFTIRCREETAQPLLDDFIARVPVGASGTGLYAFACQYLDSLLTYGSAVGEMVLTIDRREMAGLYLPPLRNLTICEGESPLSTVICTGHGDTARPLLSPELVLFTALNPAPGMVCGRPLLEGLPEISRILLTIYNAIGNNFERLGNLRYAVTYKPAAGDHADASAVAKEISREWGSAMAASACGDIRDFVAVGDVDIRVIGADNQFISTDIPVRQLLEQIVAKLGLPPFLLGLSWSSTERMSAQQSDLLTSELEAYRRLLAGPLCSICSLWLRLHGLDPTVSIEWGNISLQDETEIAAARLTNAKARQIEQALGQGPKEVIE